MNLLLRVRNGRSPRLRAPSWFSSLCQFRFCLARLYLASPCAPVLHACALYFGIWSSVACSAERCQTGPLFGTRHLFLGMPFTSFHCGNCTLGSPWHKPAKRSRGPKPWPEAGVRSHSSKSQQKPWLGAAARIHSPKRLFSLPKAQVWPIRNFMVSFGLLAMRGKRLVSR